MRAVQLHKRNIGVRLNDPDDTSVTVWAPLATEVQLQTEKGSVPLQKQQYGYWRGSTHLLQAGDRYFFVVDGKSIPDPASLAQPDGVHGPSMVMDIERFSWTDENWYNMPLKDYIFYELHTGTFSETGDFRGIEAQLDYLKDLGITAIEIMPVAQFPGNRNWGYDGVYPFAVQDSYGGPEGLQRLVNACHERGLAVVLDVVYNHSGPEGNYWQQYAPYFTDKYHTPWGKAVNFDEAWCDGVRHYFIENVLMWFRDFHIDALRMDAVHAIFDFGARHILSEIKDYVTAFNHNTGRPHYLIIECDLNDSKYIRPQSEFGYGMDAQWSDEFHHSLRVACGNEQKGYYADFNGVAHLAKAYKDAYVYDGTYSPHRLRTFGSKTDTNGSEQFIVCAQNHDQIGNRMLGERTSQLLNFEKLKLIAGAVFVSPFLPLLFMGEEYGETNPFHYFISHADEKLVAAIREGRKKEFAAFHIEGEVPAADDPATFQRSKLQWQLLHQSKHQTLFQYYKTLIALRKTHPAFQNNDRSQLEAKADPQQHTLVLYRPGTTADLVCLMNFSDEEQSVTIPPVAGNWKKLLDSSDPKWLGKAASSEKLQTATQTIPPETILIYESTHV